MRRHALALVVGVLSVASARAADVTPCTEGAPLSSRVATESADAHVIKQKGRVPVRGIGHLVAVYGAAAVSAGEVPAHLAEQARPPAAPPEVAKTAGQG